MANTTTSKLNLAVFSDVHIGHKKTPTEHTLELLRKAFPAGIETQKLDMIIIAGDLFDHILHWPDRNVTIIQIWIMDFLQLCKTHDIALRILEGTPLHDRNQPRHLQTLNDSGNIGADVRYIDKLAIVHEDRWDLDLLYIPDEWHHDPNHTWLDVQHALQQANLEQVDFAVMHGMFEHQVPPACPIVPHSNQRYQSIVKHYVFIGHIHQASFREKIIAPGSFDRICHGDEGEKGYWRLAVHLDNPELSKVTFHHNDALPYLTCNVTDMEYSDAIQKLTGLMEQELEHGSHVRIRGGKNDSLAALLEWGKGNYPLFHWTSQVKVAENKEVKREVIFEKVVAETITVNNIESLLREQMKAQGQDDATVDLAIRLLREKHLDAH